MSPYLIIWLLAVHWVGDFILQSSEMALQKSTSNDWLSTHVGVYSVVLLAGASIYNGIFGYLTGSVFTLGALLVFIALNGVLHWVTDYFTSRLSARLWKAERRHDFFVCLGGDQLVHAITLILTANWLLI